MSKSGFTAVVSRDGDWWIGWIEEIPGVNCQEETREELLQSLSEALSEVLAMNRSDAISAAGDSYEEIVISI